jgi:hypothetical protein
MRGQCMQSVIRFTIPAVAVVGTVAALTGCGSSSPAKAASTSGTETTIMTTSSTSSNPSFALTSSGVFAGKGKLVGIGNGQDSSTAKLSDGTFVVNHPQGQQKIVSESLDSSSCAARRVEQGPYTITKGTGKYAGISGSGTAVATMTATLPRLKDGKCDTSPTVTPVHGTEHVTIKAVGPVHVP